jgi:8-oxo-dGTP diphosphatase
MRVITIAYYALVRPDYVPLARAGGDADVAEWMAVSSLPQVRLAFDHGEIIDAALAHIVSRVDESDILFNLVPPTFTIPELRWAREIVTGQPQDPGNFRRRFHRMIEDGIIEEAPGKRITASKPAVVYRFIRPKAATTRTVKRT